jgi:hypothetical protein
MAFVRSSSCMILSAPERLYSYTVRLHTGTCTLARPTVLYSTVHTVVVMYQNMPNEKVRSLQ